MKKLFLLTVILTVAGCQKKTNDLPAKYQSFLNLTYELIEMKKQCSTDSAYFDSSLALYRKYQFDQTTYDQTISFFKKNPENWSHFFNELAQMQQDSIINKLD